LNSEQPISMMLLCCKVLHTRHKKHSWFNHLFWDASKRKLKKRSRLSQDEHLHLPA